MIRKTMRSSFLKLIIMYLLFLFLLLGMLIPVYRYVYRMSEENVIANSELHLKNGISKLNNLMESMQNIVSVTNTDSRFQTLKYESASKSVNKNTFPELRDAFAGLIMPHNEIADAGIVFSEIIILTRQRSFYSDNYYRFYDQFFLCEDLSYDKWLRFLFDNTDTILPVKTYYTYDYGQYQALTYVLKWSSISVNQKNIFYATLPVSNILPLLADEAIIQNGYIRIFDPYGHELLNHQNDNENIRVNLIQQTRNGRLTVEIGIPDTLLYAQLASVQKLITTFVVILISIAILLVIVFSYSSYKPFGRIIQAVTTSKHINETFQTHNLSNHSGLIKSFDKDYDSLASSITALDHRIDTYEETISSQREMIRAQILKKALQIGLFTKEEVTDFNLMLPDFPKRFFLAIFYYELPPYQTSELLINAQLHILEKMHQSLPHVISCSMSSNTIGLVISVSTSSCDFSEKIECIKKLRIRLMNQYSLPVVFRHSDIFTQVKDLVKAYEQIQTAGSLSQFSLSTWLNKKEVFQSKKNVIPLSTTKMQTIYDALLSGNLDIAESMLYDCTNFLSVNNNETFALNHTYTMLVYIIMQIKYEHPDLMSDVIIPAYGADRCFDILKEDIPNCFRQICTIIRTAHSNSIDSYAYEVLAYIKENMYNENLCVNMVADHFEISAPTLQKLVKTVTNQTFSAYIEDQRLNKAYHILVSTHETINEVSKACGFFTANSFYKAFKRKFGISPSSVLKKIVNVQTL